MFCLEKGEEIHSPLGPKFWGNRAEVDRGSYSMLKGNRSKKNKIDNEKVNSFERYFIVILIFFIFLFCANELIAL